MLNARFGHVNIVARDWVKLARFYEDVFGCKRVPPERDIKGKAIEDISGVPNAHLRGIHLRLPGHGDSGPTLEILQYDHEAKALKPVANRPGLQHICFAVDDVQAAQDALLAAGGGILGKITTFEVSSAGQVTVVYSTDPEGNIIEMNRWA